jgi:hypothetical protein
VKIQSVPGEGRMSNVEHRISKAEGKTEIKITIGIMIMRKNVGKPWADEQA